MSYIQASKGFGELILNSTVTSTGVNGDVLKVDTTTPSGFIFSAGVGSVNITDETTGTATTYPTFVKASGANQVVYIDSSGLTYNDTTNNLTTTTFTGNLVGNATNIAGGAAASVPYQSAANSSGNSGQHLVITLNGVQYKIALQNQ